MTRKQEDNVKFLTFTLSLVLALHVFSVSRAEILGNSEVFIKSGNDINLTCVAHEAPSPPSFIYWYKSGSVINYSQRGGISVLTERQTKTSKLVISRAMASDSGNYTCSPSNSGATKRSFNLCKHFNYRETSEL
jgi:hypothetical protein